MAIFEHKREQKTYIERNMKDKISQDNLVAVPASSVWELYRGFNLGRFVTEHLSDVLGTVDFPEGDGGVGSVARLTPPPGTPVFGYMKERFMIMDDEKRVKEVEQIEGGYLALGFTSLRMRLEIIENDPESSIIRSTIEYEIDEKQAQNVSLVPLKALEIIALAVEKHLVANKPSLTESLD